MRRRKKNKTSLAERLLKAGTVLFYTALLLAFLAKYISPAHFSFIALFGIAFPYLFIINFILFVLWLVNKRRIALYGLIVLGLSAFTAKDYYRLFPKKNTLVHDNSISVMSYNVRNFNIYNHWQDDDTFKRRDSIFAFIEKHKPDIICFQESYFDVLGKYKTTDTLKQLIKDSQIHAYYPHKRDNHKFGIATLTRFPIVGQGTIDFGKGHNNPCIYTDVRFQQDTIRIYNVHFASIGLSHEDFVFIDNISSLKIDIEKPDNLKHGLFQIIGLLRDAFEKRAQQVHIVAKHVSESPYPVVLCTDLNDTPASYAYRIITRKLNDAFLTSGSGVGRTYNGILPYFRIDYILYSNAFNAFDFKTHSDLDLSDHFPITTTLIMK